jgi:hypothetical protein
MVEPEWAQSTGVDGEEKVKGDAGRVISVSSIVMRFVSDKSGALLGFICFLFSLLLQRHDLVSDLVNNSGV